MRAAGWVILVLLGGSVLAGCLAAQKPTPMVARTPAPVDPLTSGNASHDHADPAQHNLTNNVSRLAHLRLTEQDGESAQTHSVDLCGNWLVLGREQTGQLGVDIVDVTNATHPVWVGKYRDPKAASGDRDVAWSADCNYVFMANQGSAPDSSGVRVINARDKARPVFESFYIIPPSVGVSGLASVGGGVHTIYALKVGADQYVYALNYGVHILKAQPDLFGKMNLTLVGRYLEADPEQILAVNQGGPDTVSTRRTIYGHDMAVYEQGGKTIMYVAYAYAGLKIVDITNPTTPQKIGEWVPGGPGAPHYVHGVKSYARADGQRITIVEAETFEDRNLNTSSPIWVLDTTNVASPVLLATWTNPGGHGADRLLFSTHFFEVENETLWLTHYHGGVWVLDLSGLGRTDDRAHVDAQPLPVRGYHLPNVDTAYRPPATCCLGWNLGGIPMTFDIKVRNGTAYASDFSTGLYVLRLDA